MSINTNLNIAPYNDDFSISKKYYRLLFKPGYALQARELTQLQTSIQNQIEQFGANIFQDGSIVKGCTFTELKNLSYVKVNDAITPTLYVDKTQYAVDGTIEEYYYQLESSSGLKASIISASNGFRSKAPDLNTFYVKYLNTISSTEQKTFIPGETISVREFKIIKQTIIDPITHVSVTNEVLVDNGIVTTIAVATFSDPIGSSYGLSVSEGIIFQKGFFLYSDAQTIILTKYIPITYAPGDFIQPHGISVGYIVNEEIITSQQDTSLLDNASGSENENAPGADRLKLSPILVAIATVAAEGNETFFTLRKYENGSASQIRNVSQYNVIGEELAKRTSEESGDYITEPFSFDTIRKSGAVYLKVGPGVVYAKGYRVENSSEIYIPIENTTSSNIQPNQPITFDYGGYVNTLNSTVTSGVVDLAGFQTSNILNSSNTVIGTAIVKNYIDTKLYLFGVRLASGHNFSEVKYVKMPSGPTGRIEIEPIIRDSKKSKLLFDIGQSYTKNITNLLMNIRVKQTITLSGGSSIATIIPNAGETFTNDSLQDILVIGSGNTKITVTSPTITGGNLVCTVGQVGGSITVYYTAQVNPASPKAKQTYDIYVKATYSNSTTKYSLGVPDAYKLLEVKDTVTGKDYTNSFSLAKNQKDDFYDHSYIEAKSNRVMPVNGNIISIKVSVYKADSAGPYNLFTVNSYSGIDPTDIPYFTGISGTYNLRDCIDLRPYRLATATYSATVGGATLVTDVVGLPTYSTQLFDSGITYAIPSLDTNNSSSVEFYLNRTDALTVDSYGKFFLVKGQESTVSHAPNVTDKTVLAEIYVPGFPTYTMSEARATGKTSYGIAIKKTGVKNYTMKDIKGISDQLENLRYYVSLTALETATQNLKIKDVNGNDRFKNGIIVDPFNDLSIADLTNPTFNASIDFTEKSLNASVQSIPLDLKVSSLSNSQLYKDTIGSLSSATQVPILSQPYASDYRTCTSNFYSYQGTGFISPDYDGSADVITTPSTINVDLTTPIDSLVESLQEIYPITSTSSTILSSNGLTSTIQDSVKTLQSTSTTVETAVGDFVTNVTFNPYIRSKALKIYMSGLRPNTRHYFFFDTVDVNAYVAPAVLLSTYSETENLFNSMGRSDAYGAIVRTNDKGELFAEFFIPANTFFVGERKLEIADVNTYDSIGSAAISTGFLTYNAYNFSVDKTSLTLSTRIPEYSINTASTTRTVTQRTVPRDHEHTAKSDPLAQTFFIKHGLAPDSNCVYASKIDLYFKRKSLTNGVTIMLREVINGYPSSIILPFSKVHLTSSQVSVSEDSSIVTTVTFKAPIRLDTEKEYCIVIKPDASDPDYLIFTSKVGGKDLITTKSVTQDWGDGVLFTSTNDTAWTSYQDEDVKFTLYRYDFSSSTGTLTFSTNDAEFFTLSDYSGSFINGEKAYTTVGSNTNITLTLGSISATGAGIAATYPAGDYIYVLNPVTAVKHLLKVKDIVSSSEVVLQDPAVFTGTFSSLPAIVGEVNYYNPLRRDTLRIEKSSARSTRTFNANTTITGLKSSAYGIIGSVNNLQISYIQPSIQRITDNASNVTASLIVVNPSAPSDTPYTKEMKFNNKTLFNERGCIIYSKSNDLIGAKNLKIQLTLGNSGVTTSSPIIDTETAFITAGIYNITNTVTSSSKYISKVVTLAENFDAQDFKVYITGYRPVGTNIDVDIRVKHAVDPLLISDNPWIPLIPETGANMFTSTTNINDFKEYIYDVPDANKVNNILTYTNTSGTYTGYKSFQLRITLRSISIGSVPRLLDYRGLALE